MNNDIGIVDSDFLSVDCKGEIRFIDIGNAIVSFKDDPFLPLLF